ncbi:DUF6875 domain-containing protein [Actinophytocola glycyrrhizae]|uniref:DUF6875 domain-containing protein n=1 Tax=Actinophytocola glycyrrhizae TaxID=2044873 RepID=A0ABV9RYV2_9PSEU
MLTHPTLDLPPLVEPADLDGDLPAAVRTWDEPLRAILGWALRYLCRPHPELGRKGDVCPFTEGALARHTFYMAVCGGLPVSADEVAGTVAHYRDWFLDLPPTSGSAAQFKTILILFPELTGPDLHPVIDEAQRVLKQSYVSHGLMVGEFHDGPPDKAGLWNSSFRPLRSPVPLLAIRHMVPTDFPFLSLDDDHVTAYLRLFGDRVPTHLRPQVAAATARLGKAVP